MTITAAVWDYVKSRYFVAMNEMDIRWRQRFHNFQRTFGQLSNAVAKEELNDLERAGLIQFFEFSFELGWKTLKDYLNHQRVDVKYPRDVVKEAFRLELISDGVWIDILEKRNLMAHTYDEEKAAEACQIIITSYFPALSAFNKYFQNV